MRQLKEGSASFKNFLLIKHLSFCIMTTVWIQLLTSLHNSSKSLLALWAKIKWKKSLAFDQCQMSMGCKTQEMNSDEIKLYTVQGKLIIFWWGLLADVNWISVYLQFCIWPTIKSAESSHSTSTFSYIGRTVRLSLHMRPTVLAKIWRLVGCSKLLSW